MTYSPRTSGFSLVETLVAITILLVVIVGPMTIASNATQGTNFSSEQVIAFFLAQEGAELAQKARDDVLLPFFVTPGATNAAWTQFSGSGSVYDDCFNGGCGLSVDTDTDGTILVEDCNSVTDRANCRLVYEDSVNVRARYNHTSGTDTIYTRIITMTENSGQEIEVVSRVTWQTGDRFQEQSAEVVTYLYNVYGR